MQDPDEVQFEMSTNVEVPGLTLASGGRFSALVDQIPFESVSKNPADISKPSVSVPDATQEPTAAHATLVKES